MDGIAASLVWRDGVFAPNAVVLFHGGRITGVCDRADVPAGAAVRDWGDVALVPGAVNAHGHSFQSLLKGFADDRHFSDWRDAVLYPRAGALDARSIYSGALFAFAESLLGGTTTTVDFFYLHDSCNDNARAVIAAARALGIRLVLARSFYDVDARTGAPARFREPRADAVRRTLDLAHDHSGDDDVFVQPAAHSLHACEPGTIAAALRVAADLDAPCHLHLAEARYERDEVTARFGLSPVRLLAREGLLEPRLVTVHAVWVDDEELDLLAQSDCAVAHCPAANAFLGDGIAPVTDMLKRGIRVGLGADGGCANNRQSIWDEMRTASLLQKARLNDGGALTAPEALRLGTSGSADLLDIPAGRIEPGCFADIVALDLSHLSLQPAAGGIERHVVNAMLPGAIARVMVGGEIVVERGRLIRMDHSEIRARIAEATRGWVRP